MSASSDAQLRSPLGTRALTKQFGDLVAVDHLSFTARPGEILALLGPNGAGKTTLMRMLVGLLRPTSGSVMLMGAPISAVRRQRAALIGYCPQRLVIWHDLTCLEQLVFVARMFKLPPKASQERAMALLDAFGLSDKTDTRAAHLSGGMQRRLSIALSMIHDPKILILDEPAAGLDPQSRVLVREQLVQLSRQGGGKTLLVSTHDIAEAERMADRVGIVDQGTLLALDRPAALKQASGPDRLIEIVLPHLSDHQYARAEVALGALGPKVRRFDERVVLDVHEGPELVRPIRTVLGKLGISPLDLRWRHRSLEDVFIELTGRRLRE
ncbi:MAG: ABC transporter ATP-binding protein [Myxococcota bacterium]|nr:ABC transporter ATP-binding protein [Myxococcota bacterium]